MRVYQISSVPSIFYGLYRLYITHLNFVECDFFANFVFGI